MDRKFGLEFSDTAASSDEFGVLRSRQPASVLACRRQVWID